MKRELPDTQPPITNYFKKVKLNIEAAGDDSLPVYGDKVAVPPTHTPGTAITAGWEQRERPEGVFYKGSKLPVAVGDLVVRLRSNKAIAAGGRDQDDMFDGPLEIEKIFPIIHSNRALRNQGVEKKDARDKMWKTKVKLSFSVGVGGGGGMSSMGPKWVEVGELVPLYHDVLRGDRFKNNGNNKCDITLEQCRRKSPEVLYFAEIALLVSLALTIVDPRAASNDDWEVEKLRGKRLRIYEADSKVIRNNNLATNFGDAWIEKIVSERSNLKSKVVVAEYLVHWGGLGASG